MKKSLQRLFLKMILDQLLKVLLPLISYLLSKLYPLVSQFYQQ